MKINIESIWDMIYVDPILTKVEYISREIQLFVYANNGDIRGLHLKAESIITFVYICYCSFSLTHLNKSSCENI